MTDDMNPFGILEHFARQVAKEMGIEIDEESFAKARAQLLEHCATEEPKP